MPKSKNTRISLVWIASATSSADATYAEPLQEVAASVLAMVDDDSVFAAMHAGRAPRSVSWPLICRVASMPFRLGMCRSMTTTQRLKLGSELFPR